MPVTLPATYQNALTRQADITQTMNDLFNVVQQLNGVTGTGLGYVTGQGVGGTINQTVDRTTAVTINKLSGTIGIVPNPLAPSTAASMVVNNTFVSIGDAVIITPITGYVLHTTIFTVGAVANGSFTLRMSNISTSVTDNTSPLIAFLIIKGAAT